MQKKIGKAQISATEILEYVIVACILMILFFIIYLKSGKLDSEGKMQFSKQKVFLNEYEFLVKTNIIAWPGTRSCEKKIIAARIKQTLAALLSPYRAQWGLSTVSLNLQLISLLRHCISIIGMCSLQNLPYLELALLFVGEACFLWLNFSWIKNEFSSLRNISTTLNFLGLASLYISAAGNVGSSIEVKIARFGYYTASWDLLAIMMLLGAVLSRILDLAWQVVLIEVEHNKKAGVEACEKVLNFDDIELQSRMHYSMHFPGTIDSAAFTFNFEQYYTKEQEINDIPTYSIRSKRFQNPIDLDDQT